jgi:hypothetical protein
MDLVGGNKPVEIPDPQDSSTMEESVVTFSGQRRKVGDLVSSPESVGSSMEKRERTRFLAWIYIASREMGQGKRQDRIQRMFPRGKGWGHDLRNGEHQTPGLGTGPSHRRVLGRVGRDRRQSSLQRYVSF